MKTIPIPSQMQKNQVQPIGDIPSMGFNNNKFSPESSRQSTQEQLDVKQSRNSNSPFPEVNEEFFYLRLKPFKELDPTLKRLLNFLKYFGLTINFITKGKQGKNERSYANLFKIVFMVVIGVIAGQVVYDVNIRQSKLLAEQKRSTPLLTFVIIAYSWLTLAIPVICNFSLIYMGSHLFRFYSRTTATVCNGMFFGRRTFVDSYVYYWLIIVIALFDAVGQVVVLGVWPPSISALVKMLATREKELLNVGETSRDLLENFGESHINHTSLASTTALIGQVDERRINAHLLDLLLGEQHAHGDLGVCLKILCLMVQFLHSYAFLMIIISLSDHYANVITNINENLDKYDYRRLFKQLIVLRDSSEQISLMISIPFACVIILISMRQIALNGVFIQSSMLPYENWAVSVQSFTSGVATFMIFIYCDRLQSASKQAHRLRTEQTIMQDSSRGANQSNYEFLDYLNRLSKSIRITFLNIITINKSSLVGLCGHILTLTFVTS